MRSRIRKCKGCNILTLREECPKCNIPTENTFPPRYSPQDRYGKYRRMYLRSETVDDPKD